MISVPSSIKSGKTDDTVDVASSGCIIGFCVKATNRRSEFEALRARQPAKSLEYFHWNICSTRFGGAATTISRHSEVSMSPTQRPSASVFYSYSHKDERLRDDLADALALLKRQSILTEWHDRKIAAGDDWEQSIDEHMERADVILLLVSPVFIASDYCWGKEVERAMERHKAGEARVIPIVLRPVDWNGAMFGKLQALPKNAKPITLWSNRAVALGGFAWEKAGWIWYEALRDKKLKSDSQFVDFAGMTQLVAARRYGNGSDELR